MKNFKWEQIAELQTVKELLIEDALSTHDSFSEDSLEQLGEDLKLIDAALIKLTSEENSNIVNFTEFKNKKRFK